MDDARDARDALDANGKMVDNREVTDILQELSLAMTSKSTCFSNYIKLKVELAKGTSRGGGGGTGLNIHEYLEGNYLC